jgi:hypothetical protein
LPPLGLTTPLRLAVVLGLCVGAFLLGLPVPVHASVGTQGLGPHPLMPDLVAETEEATGFLRALVREINVRRARVGHQPVGIAPAAANAGVTRYLSDLTPLMLASGVCFHGTGDQIPPAWDYVARTGVGSPGSGEVMTCPAGDGYWTVSRVAESWWASELHHAILYGDPNVNLVACGAFGPQRGGAAYTTIACVTFQG